MSNWEPDLSQRQKTKVAKGCTYGLICSVAAWILIAVYIRYA